MFIEVRKHSYHLVDLSPMHCLQNEFLVVREYEKLAAKTSACSTALNAFYVIGSFEGLPELVICHTVIFSYLFERLGRILSDSDFPIDFKLIV